MRSRHGHGRPAPRVASARRWDFRQGRERPDAREPAFDPGTAGLVLTAAAALGLVRATPPARSGYAHLLVLGGLAHACLRRTAYAALLARTARVGGEVAVLGSFRPLSPAESAMLAGAGVPGYATEVDVLDAGVRLAFGVDEPARQSGGPADHPHRAWSSRTYRPAGLPPVRVLAAPSSEPDRRRAHTADTQRFWAEHVRLRAGDPVLMVTAPIYVPFQHCDALRTLAVPYGCGIETVGVDPAASAPVPVPEPTLTRAATGMRASAPAFRPGVKAGAGRAVKARAVPYPGRFCCCMSCLTTLSGVLPAGPVKYEPDHSLLAR
ncbi:hypothetical protein [Micromonospora maritima]|uniref:hypothetical protein n=1 Tax=Micromonospora maritima TaxID=986711 RepID=UPI00379034A8